MEIKLIKRELKNGRTSLVLEYYLGYTLGANGTTRPKRKFETLEYFLYTAPRNKAERDHNKINLEMAEKVKAKRLLAEQNEQYGFAVPFKIRTNLVYKVSCSQYDIPIKFVGLLSTVRPSLCL